jgi:hypothetical protein
MTRISKFRFRFWLGRRLRRPHLLPLSLRGRPDVLFIRTTRSGVWTPVESTGLPKPENPHLNFRVPHARSLSVGPLFSSYVVILSAAKDLHSPFRVPHPSRFVRRVGAVPCTFCSAALCVCEFAAFHFLCAASNNFGFTFVPANEGEASSSLARMLLTFRGIRRLIQGGGPLYSGRFAFRFRSCCCLLITDH